MSRREPTFRPRTLSDIAKEEVSRMQSLHQNPVWGNWTYRPLNLTLEHANSYYIDLEECETGAQISDWIFQIADKILCTPKDMMDLLQALRDLINPQGEIIHATSRTPVARLLERRGFTI